MVTFPNTINCNQLKKIVYESALLNIMSLTYLNR